MQIRIPKKNNMKVINFFAQLFSIFAFLTLGSLLILVALHVLSVEDAVFKVQELYGSPAKSLQTGVVGLLFISIGLIFSKTLLKKGRDSDAIIFHGESGPMFVSIKAIEDLVKKVLKKNPLVKDWRIKTIIHGKNLEIKIRLILWSGGSIPQLLAELQDDVSDRVRKILGPENQLEVVCDVQKIEDENPIDDRHGENSRSLSA